jgi:SOS-response transcriptional repressor LexA
MGEHVDDGLTERQELFLLLIDDYIKQGGKPPTRRELTKLGGQKSTHGVNQLLTALQKKGYITIHPRGVARNIVVDRVPTKQLLLPEVVPNEGIG